MIIFTKEIDHHADGFEAKKEEPITVLIFEKADLFFSFLHDDVQVRNRHMYLM